MKRANKSVSPVPSTTDNEHSLTCNGALKPRALEKTSHTASLNISSSCNRTSISLSYRRGSATSADMSSTPTVLSQPHCIDSDLLPFYNGFNHHFDSRY